MGANRHKKPMWHARGHVVIDNKQLLPINYFIRADNKAKVKKIITRRLRSRHPRSQIYFTEYTVEKIPKT